MLAAIPAMYLKVPIIEPTSPEGAVVAEHDHLALPLGVLPGAEPEEHLVPAVAQSVKQWLCHFVFSRGAPRGQESVSE